MNSIVIPRNTSRDANRAVPAGGAAGADAICTLLASAAGITRRMLTQRGYCALKISRISPLLIDTTYRWPSGPV